MRLFHATLLLGGLFLTSFGFWGAFHFRRPFDGLIAWVTPIGLVCALLGALLLVIPDFWQF
jgi:hypothetical protein